MAPSTSSSVGGGSGEVVFSAEERRRSVPEAVTQGCSRSAGIVMRVPGFLSRMRVRRWVRLGEVLAGMWGLGGVGG